MPDMYWMIAGLSVILATVLVMRELQDRRLRERTMLAMKEDEEFEERCYEELLKRIDKVAKEKYDVTLINSSAMLSRMKEPSGTLSYVDEEGRVTLLKKTIPTDLNGVTVVSRENEKNELLVPKNAAALGNFFRKMLYELTPDTEEIISR